MEVRPLLPHRDSPSTRIHTVAAEVRRSQNSLAADSVVVWHRILAFFAASSLRRKKIEQMRHIPGR